MRRLVIILIVIITILLMYGVQVQAGPPRVTSLPGDWQAESTFCRDGISIVVTGTLGAGNTSVVSILSLTPAGQTGPILDFASPGAVRASVIIPFAAQQTPGTPVTMLLDRLQNGASTTGGAGADASGAVDDCTLADPLGAGRVNRDIMAPAAIYCKGSEIEVWAVDTDGVGHLAFRATGLEISTVGIPRVNTLIDSGYGIGLYRLTSGEFQVNSARRRPPSYFVDIAPRASATTTAPVVTGTTSTTTVTAPTGSILHVIQRGENLFRISLRYGVPMSVIASLNNIQDVRRIYAGDTLIIPVGGTYTITPTTVTTGTTTTGTPSTVTQPTSAIGSDYIYTFKGCSSS